MDGQREVRGEREHMVRGLARMGYWPARGGAEFCFCAQGRTRLELVAVIGEGLGLLDEVALQAVAWVVCALCLPAAGEEVEREV